MTEHWRTPHRPRRPFDGWKSAREFVAVLAMWLLAYVYLFLSVPK